MRCASREGLLLILLSLMPILTSQKHLLFLVMYRYTIVAIKIGLFKIFSFSVSQEFSFSAKSLSSCIAYLSFLYIYCLNVQCKILKKCKLCCMYVIRWIANLTKFRILKYQYVFSFFLTEKINLLLVQQKNVDQSLSFSQLKVNNNKYSHFKIRNFVKLATHRMTYIRHKIQNQDNFSEPSSPSGTSNIQRSWRWQ